MKLTEDSNNIIKFIKSNFYNTEYKLSKTNIKFFTNILKLANKALNKWQDMKKNVTLSSSTITDFHDIPFVIKNDIINNYLNKISFDIKINDKIFTINLYFIVLPKDNIILNIFKKIYIWFYIACHYSTTTNNNFNINIYFTEHKKNLPINDDKLDVIHVNSAFTNPCSNSPSVFIFRNEEWFKVLIHETFHNMGFDFSCIDSSIPDRVVYMITKMKKNDIRSFEAYTESWANIINMLFTAFYSTRVKSNYNLMIQKFQSFIPIEINFSLIQLVKILDHYDIKYSDIYSDSPQAIINKSKYSEKTYVVSYFIIKIIFLFHFNYFVEWCLENNNNTFVFNKSKKNINNFSNLIFSLYKTPEFINKIKLIENIEINDEFIKNTCRMSVFEIM